MKCDTRPKAVLQSLKHTHAWRSTVWWTNTKALNMVVDPNGHTRWRQKRGCVWDKIASEWAGMEEWSEKRKMSKCSGQERFHNFRSDCVKHSVAFRPKIGEVVKPNKERKAPRKLEPPDLSIAPRTEGTTVQM